MHINACILLHYWLNTALTLPAHCLNTSVLIIFEYSLNELLLNSVLTSNKPENSLNFTCRPSEQCLNTVLVLAEYLQNYALEHCMKTV